MLLWRCNHLKWGEQYLDELIKHFCDETMSKPSLAASLAEILDNLNYMHSFREGNGRTQREVVRVLA
ncbi:Fic family protein [Enterococcus asini]|uniref:Fic family protein n=1 Tax=Enterococcus asini TaxID=57732 RepID=UPI0030102096